jgi:citrate synthase
MGNTGFTDYFLLLLTGERPSPMLIKMADASLVAIAEHGLVPSVVAARMTLAAAPAALQGAVAAGLLGCGSVILGASETAGRLLVGVRRSFLCKQRG